jgi:hypothetical protein
MEVIRQIQERFSDATQYEYLQFLNPARAYNLNVQSLSKVYERHPGLNDVAPQDLATEEWRSHALLERLDAEQNCTEYWGVLKYWGVLNAKNATGTPTHSNLMKVVTSMFSFPFSNASVERLFSQLKLIKNDRRNCMKQETLVSLLMFKTHVSSRDLRVKKQGGKGGRYAASLSPSSDMMNLYRGMKSEATDAEANTIRFHVLSKL